MRHPLLIILLIIFSPFLKAQQCECLNNLEKQEKLDSLIDVANFDELIQASRNLVNNNENLCKSLGYAYFAEAAVKQGLIDSAKKLITISEQILENTTCDKNTNLQHQSVVAQIYFSDNNYEKALEHSLRMLELALQEKNEIKSADSYIKVANIFIRMSQPEKAREYSVKARQSIERLPESFKKYHLYNMLSNRYINLYQDFKEKRYLDTVETFMTGIRSHAVKMGKYNRLIEQYYRKQATLALKTKELDKSFQYLDSAQQIIKHFPIRGELYSIWGDKANIYRKQKKFKEAEIFADSCLLYAKTDNVVSSVINGFDIVYMVARDAGKSDKALWAFENMTRINDSIIDVKNTGKITELEQKYNKSQNEKTIRELNQEAEIKNLRIRVLAIGIAMAVMVIIVIVFFYRQSLIKNRQKVLEAEQRLNRSRINPHFFFNAITTLQGIAVKENDGKKVALNLYKFSSLMRQTLESSYNDYVSIDTELEFIQKYIELQQLKETDKFTFKTIVSDEVETSDTLIPAMIIQPFLENSIEHGFGNINYSGVIELYFAITNNHLKITIKDNGAGLNKDSQKPNKHISRAMQITKDRLYLLNKDKKSDASFTVNSIEPHGVKVEIVLPLIYK